MTIGEDDNLMVVVHPNTKMEDKPILMKSNDSKHTYVCLKGEKVEKYYKKIFWPVTKKSLKFLQEITLLIV